ncbi:hypothetical protein D3C85_1774270 [compost metagenome]
MLKKWTSRLGFGLFILVIAGTGIGHREHCQGEYWIESNMTTYALYSLMGLELCGP